MDPDDSTKIILDQLPRGSFFENLDLRQRDGFWYRPRHLEAAVACYSRFEARDDDVILASAMKTGSTWLKALCFSIMQRHCGGDGEKNEDLLAVHHPAFYVQTLEVQVYTANPPPDLSGMQSPRLFHTHLPYSALPESIKKSKCKTVYITRNPKDTFVSMWHFFNTRRTPEQGPYPLEDAFESFCNGVFHYGPFFDHVLQYWNQSLKMPHKILFLKYEDLQRNPKDQVKRLASFLGKPFADGEEVEELIRKCSLERLKNLEVNKKGVDPWVGMPNSAFFRKGVVGDWENVLTPEMNDRLDQITCMKLKGSGLDLVHDATTCKKLEGSGLDLEHDATTCMKLEGSGLDLEHDATTCMKLETSGLDLVHDAATTMNLEGSGRSDLMHDEITCMKPEARGDPA
ncbi:Cytosolic sulfotransferase 5 [Morella rubra]|uniref:Sulfotransferase n=1 Tax=Morella rubra TaxID=262757 RepID=A0A6A1WRP1_9ROSI|nr:Cytosolic sulfotransferase 5 [Morella rubra]